MCDLVGKPPITFPQAYGTRIMDHGKTTLPLHKTMQRYGVKLISYYGSSVPS